MLPRNAASMTFDAYVFGLSPETSRMIASRPDCESGLTVIRETSRQMLQSEYFPILTFNRAPSRPMIVPSICISVLP